MNHIIDKINKNNLKSDVPSFTTGDTVEVHARIKEGDKERVQIFAGTVIAIDGTGATETFTVRKISFNSEGVEKVFPIHSPMIEDIKVTRLGKTRRAKLYYIRDLAGKKARIAERREDLAKSKSAAKIVDKASPAPVEAEAAPAEETPAEETTENSGE